MTGQLPADWSQVLATELAHPSWAALQKTLVAERAAGPVFPPENEVFSAFHLTPFESVRAVILGQDPYHGEGQAHGLAFSVKEGVRAPPSLLNIFKELKADVGVPIPPGGSLVPWAKRGVLLLNAVLTVRSGEPNAHKELGWERLTDGVIKALNVREAPVVFVLWGAYARKKAKLIDTRRHRIVEGAHPSPLSAKLWFGSKPFSSANAALESMGQPTIDWSLS